MKFSKGLWCHGFVALLFYLQCGMVCGDAKINRVAETCRLETNITADESNLIITDEFEKLDENSMSHNMKCFLLCFHREFGVIDANGDPIEKEFLNFIEIRFANKKDKVAPALAKCKALTDSDPCEHTYKFEMCMAHTIEGDKWDI
ncbi:uncharacterized protein LOC142239586 [Haematobia irritans]|uniref:uncharacterized protein LOC142239586 n=1 Tax=Haematobia irritans TaxID=7368 RepID=UPI003F4F74F1